MMHKTLDRSKQARSNPTRSTPAHKTGAKKGPTLPVHVPHPLLSIGGAHEEGPQDALIISFTHPGGRIPPWVQGRLNSDETLEAPALFRAGYHRLGSKVEVISAWPTSRGEDAVKRSWLRWATDRARASTAEGQLVHVQCSEGRTRSVSLALMILAELHPDFSGDELLARMASLRPEAFSPENPGAKPGFNLLSAARWHLEYVSDLEFPERWNVRWN